MLPDPAPPKRVRDLDVAAITGAAYARPSRVPAAALSGLRGLLLAAALTALGAGCASAPSQLGRTERLPEGTLPPSKEVGPPVNIQPAPLARDEYRAVLRAPVPFHSPFYGRGWYGPRCFDPYGCNHWRPGFGLHYRVF